MKKTVIVNIPMIKKTPAVYASDDLSLPVADKAVLYPINAFLEKTLKPSDELKVVLLTKNGMENQAAANVERFKSELETANESIGAFVNYIEINTDFSEAKDTHEQLLLGIVDEITEGDQLLADITHGPKDMPIVVFTAFNFAEKYLGCEIENIIYGQAKSFDGPIAKDTYICDMSPLYYLNSITNTIACDSPEKAKGLLKSIIEI